MGKNRAIFSTLLLLTICLFTSLNNAIAKDSELISESTIILESRYTELVEERKRIRSELRDLEPALKLVDEAKLEIQQAKPDLITGKSAIEDIKTALKNLSTLPDETNLTDDHPAMESYRSAYRGLKDSSGRDLYDKSRVLYSIFPDEGVLTSGERILKRSLRNCDTPVTPLDAPKTWSKPSRVDSSARIA